jgi:hypothetical protein
MGLVGGWGGSWKRLKVVDSKWSVPEKEKMYDGKVVSSTSL